MVGRERDGNPEEPVSERTQPYEKFFESQCRGLTPQFLKAAKWMSVDSDRRVFHRFDVLRVYVLLRLQHRLAAMATELEQLQREQDKREDKCISDSVKDEVLNDLAADVGSVLKEYDDVFWSQARFEGLRSPPAKFMSNYIKFSGTRYPALPKDLGATGSNAAEVTALASTAVKEKSAAHRFVDKYVFLQRLFAVKSEHDKHDKHGKHGKHDEHDEQSSSVFIYSESAISRVERTLVHVSFCILLLCPIIALSLIESAVGKLTVVIIFLLLAAFLTSGLLTGANNAGLAVLAGYGAILIFFLGVKVDFSK